MEGMTVCSQDETRIHKEQGDEWVKGKGGEVSNTLTVTFQCACVTMAKMMN